MKRFNTAAVCIPSKHYMTDLSKRVRKIKNMVDDGKYFTINRARQYGKTTTLAALKQILVSQYTVLFLDFQGIDKEVFHSSASFSQAMARLFIDQHEFKDIPIPEEILKELIRLNDSETERVKMDDLFRIIKRWIKKADHPVVLIIDEVDTAADNHRLLRIHREHLPRGRILHTH